MCVLCNPSCPLISLSFSALSSRQRFDEMAAALSPSLAGDSPSILLQPAALRGAVSPLMCYNASTLPITVLTILTCFTSYTKYWLLLRNVVLLFHRHSYSVPLRKCSFSRDNFHLCGPACLARFAFLIPISTKCPTRIIFIVTTTQQHYQAKTAEA